jgi:hypothetical protein
VSYVTDMTHFQDEDGAPPPGGRAARIVDFFGRITWAGSLHEPERWVRTPIACRRRPGRQPCPGTIAVQRRPGDEIAWQCTACEEGGTIHHWEGSPWDLRPLVMLAAVNRLLTVRWPLAEFRVLERCTSLGPDDAAVLYRGELGDDGAVVARASEEEWEILALGVAAELKRARAAERRRLLAGALARIEAAGRPGR